MRCILHIGTSKTGTTSLQQVLRRNRPALLAAGVLTPECLGPNHAGIGLYAQDDDRIRTWHGAFAAEALADRDAYRAHLRQTLAEEVAQAQAAGAHTLLIVCEFLSGLQRASEFERLADLLRGLCDSTEVVVYLRRQDRHLESEYTTALFSRRRETRPLDQIVRTPRDYLALLEAWRIAFAPDALTPRVFEADQLVGGDVVTDFFATARLATPPGYAGRGRANVSVTPLGQEAMRQVNLMLADAGDDPRVLSAHRQAREAIRQRFQGAGQRLSPAVAADLLRRAAHTNQEVARRWFGRDELFARQEPDRATPLPPASDPVIAEILELARLDLAAEAA